MRIRDYPISTEVIIEGDHAPCHVHDLRSGEPTVLDGLTLTWGRGTLIDQPDVGTCTFTVRRQLVEPDPEDIRRLFDLVHVGDQVEVWAEAWVPATNSEMMGQTDFTGGGALDPRRWRSFPVSGSARNVSVDLLPYGVRAAAWVTWPGRGIGETWPVEVAFAPRPFALATEPGAWDHIPHIEQGDEWTITAVVWVPAGTTARLAARGQVLPYRDAPTANLAVSGDRVQASGVDQWVTLVGTVSLIGGQSPQHVLPSVIFDPMPSVLTWQGTDPATWRDQGVRRWIDLDRGGVASVSVVNVEPVRRRSLVWYGRITGLIGQAEGYSAASIVVTASDPGFTLANTTIGDEPWEAETAATRVDKVLDLGHVDDLQLIFDLGLRDIMIAYRDVDAQPVLGLLQDIATSIGGVCWVTGHQDLGPYLWIEDPDEREAARQFVWDGGMVIIGGNDRNASKISARDVLRDPVQWAQELTNMINSVDVTWQSEIPPPEPGEQTQTEERTVTVEVPGLTPRTRRKLSVPTELTNATDAAALASRILAQVQAVDWIASGFQINTTLLRRDIPSLAYSDRISMIMDLLDSTRRIGRLMVMIEVPEYLPPGAVGSGYVEGGTYLLDDHEWQLDLNVSAAGSQGESARWQDMDGSLDWRWTDLDPEIRWNDAYGVAGPNWTPQQLILEGN